MDKMGLKYRILARVKSIYSIWNKMQTKHVPFEEIYDLLAVRIIFEPRNADEELNDCFDIYVSISKIYKPHPDRLRDWVRLRLCHRILQHWTLHFPYIQI